MNLAAVMDEVAQVMQQLTKVNVFALPQATITPPAGMVGYPDSIQYDQTYGRGIDQFTDLPIWLVVGKATDLTARDTAALWSAGTGSESIKARMEAHTWTSCDDLTVTAVSFSSVTIGAVTYLAAVFDATVVGPGGA